MITALLRGVVRGLLRLRYRIQTSGLEEIAARGTRGILFLPNHTALIDPPIVVSELHRVFAPRVLADKDQVSRPPLRWFASRAGIQALPDPARYGDASRAEVERILGESAAVLEQGGNLLLYPAGHLSYTRLEDLGANSAVELLLKRVPNARVVLIRNRGLWGSSFSRASGVTPDMAKAFLKGAKAILANGLFFTPRRPVSIELVEPKDLPRNADRATLNRFMETYYNQEPPSNTYVPYTLWEKGGVRTLPEPAAPEIAGDVSTVPAATRDIVVNYLRDRTGRKELKPGDKLATDLGLDSLSRVEVSVWLEHEFGFKAGEDVLRTVADVLLAACGNIAAAGPVELKPVPPHWFRDANETGPVTVPEGQSLTDVFLARARQAPDQVIMADQTGGARTYRDVITAILVLKPEIEKLSGQHIGIMLPASAGASIVYLAVLYSGKIPVMVNWTVGTRNMVHSLDLLNVRHVLTAGALVQKVESQGGSLAEMKNRFVMLEDLGKRIGHGRKIGAAIMSRLSWRALSSVRLQPSDTAVVLFTSGSESLPKAVPLTHANLLTNIRDLTKIFHARRGDRLLGMLPPFHSFGLSVTMCYPLCAGIRTVYYPNPTDGGVLARLIEAYRATLLVSTPTFLQGILRAATGTQIAGIRAVMSGAEKCPAQLYEAVAQRLPDVVLLEGYGITECSPVLSFNDECAPQPQTIGRMLPSVQYAIVDVESGQRVSPGRAGLLLVRGPSIFGGYLKYDGPSPFVEFEGVTWYRTGDLVAEDAKGILTFAGRLKRFVKLGGEMVSLPAIEEVLTPLYSTPEDEGPILAVEGTPVDTNPELVLFTVKPLDRETVNRQIREAGLSPLHNIRSIIELPELPLLGTGKTNYRALKERLASVQGRIQNPA